MHYPWNKKYISICIHAAITVIAVYLIGLLLTKLPEAKDTVLSFFDRFLSLLSPLVAAIFISMLLNRPVDFFQRQFQRIRPPKNPSADTRKAGTLLAYLTVFLVLGLIVSFAASKIGSLSAASISQKFSAFVTDISDLLVYINVKLAELGILQSMEGELTQWSETIAEWAQKAIPAFAASLPKAGNVVLNLVIAMTISFYFLYDKNRLKRFWHNISEVFFGKKTTEIFSAVISEVYTVFTGYLGGQMLDAIIMAILISVSFSIAGIPYAVTIGIISGFSNLIPYFGAIMAFVLSVLVGLLSGMPIKALYAAIIVLALQQVDSILIVPRVVGKSVELHPVMVLLSLAVFGGLFGFLGLLFAVPLGALTKDFFFFLYHKKQEWNQKQAST